jgi:hypothetical protein
MTTPPESCWDTPRGKEFIAICQRVIARELERERREREGEKGKSGLRE